MLLYSNLASLHFSNKYWITLNFAEIHIFRIYRSHTLLICIWFPWNISDFTLNRVKRGRRMTRRGRRYSIPCASESVWKGCVFLHPDASHGTRNLSKPFLRRKVSDRGGIEEEAPIDNQVVFIFSSTSPKILVFYKTLCLKKLLDKLRVPHAEPDARTRNLSKRFLRHKVMNVQH